MTGFLRRQAVVAMMILLSSTNGAPIDKHSSYCKVSKTARGLIKHLLPMSLILGGDIHRSYVNISKQWLTPADQWTTAEFSFSLSQPLNRSRLQPGTILFADRNILSSFLALIQNSTVSFRRFPKGAAAVHQLMNLESALRNMISYLRKLEIVFSQGSNATVHVGSVISGSYVSAVLPMRTSQITSQNSTRLLNSSLPTAHSVALRVSLILNDLYSSLLEMDVDFNKILRTKCIKG